jgi:hypothetical protein
LQKNNSKYKLKCRLLGFALIFFGFRVFAQVPGTFTYQGKLSFSNNSAVAGNYNFKIQIFDPTATCLLYQEQHSNVQVLDDGLFNLSVGSQLSSSKRMSDDPGLSMVEIFANSNAEIRPASSSNCTIGYTPSGGDKRRMRVTITNLQTSEETVLSPIQEIQVTPYSLLAESASSLEGKRKGDFIQVEGVSLTQANVRSLTDKVTEVLALVTGSGQIKLAQIMTDYSGAGRMTVANNPSAGTDAVNKNYCDSKVAGKDVDSSVSNPGASEDGKFLAWSQSQSKYTLQSPIGGGGSGLPTGSQSGQTLRFDGSNFVAAKLQIGDLVNNFAASPFGSSNCGVSQTLYFNSATDSFACQTIAINGSQLADGSLATAKLANLSVTDDKIAAVAATKLTGTISAERLPAEVKLGNLSSTCDSNAEGLMRYNSTSKIIEICDGANWVSGGNSAVNNSLANSGLPNCPSGVGYSWNGSQFVCRSGPAISSTPTVGANLNLGSGTSPSQCYNFVIANTGDAPTATVSTYIVAGADQYQLSGCANTCSGNVIAAGASCNVGVRAISTSNKSLSGTLLVGSNQGGVLQISLSGVASGFGATCTPGSIIFNYTGATQDFTVPAGCTHLKVKAWGAGGGGGGYPDAKCGGPGGFAEGVFSVSSGQAMKITVGQGGKKFNNGLSGTAFGGGGQGYDWGGGGGGYSGIFNSSVSFADALLIAGGGGGASGNNGTSQHGGPGGGLSGTSGSNIASPGTQSSGFTTLLGGSGSSSAQGGGGGGGYYGGSSTSTLGGGGGSGFGIGATLLSANVGDLIPPRHADPERGTAGVPSCRGDTFDGKNGLLVVEYMGSNPCSASSPQIGLTCGVPGYFAGDFNGRKYVVQKQGCSGTTNEPSCIHAVDTVQMTWSSATGNITQLTDITLATNVDPNIGSQNQFELMSQNSASPGPFVAAKYCDDLVLGGFSDWYLPSKSELAFVMCNSTAGDGAGYPQEAPCTSTNLLSGFAANQSYWTSTEASASDAWTISTTNKAQQSTSKLSNNFVRCVRSW